MQFQSLLCIHGRDNGARFAVISASVYLMLLLVFLLVGQGGAMLVVGVIFAPLLVLTAYRRMRDAARQNWYSVLPLIPLSLFSMTLAFADSTLLTLVTLLFAIALSAFLAVFPSKGKVSRYDYGYVGPVAKKSGQIHRRRVEPTLDADGTSHYAEDSDTEFETSNDSGSQQDWDSPSTARQFSASLLFSRYLDFAKQHPKVLISVAGGLLAITLFSALWGVISGPEEETVEVSPSAVEEPIAMPSREEAKIPDGFSLVLEDNVLIMRWLGETRSPGEIWSQASALGDKSCAHLKFNNGTEYRPLLVEYMPDTAIEARFSPLDTQNIITDIARRGSVKLCGYDFSLKGSQSALARNAAFIPYL
ncbi:DUF805 domain-containing protein [Shewanella sp. UCD-KL12]|uniref:DUF805 domain-containing protein n=1 Tax=Shewanella sp. UCD-KL12 TaxID=1917163 RepID=UPI000970E2C3|nr:DUF805 domain-containing protein [Shewanella sp. UCD-KL12]